MKVALCSARINGMCKSQKVKVTVYFATNMVRFMWKIIFQHNFNTLKSVIKNENKLKYGIKK